MCANPHRDKGDRCLTPTAREGVANKKKTAFAVFFLNPSQPISADEP